MSFNKIRIEATIKADHSLIWNAWTQPEHISKWNFATEDWSCPKAEVDLKVGGHYMARMEAKDGSFGFDFEGTYTDVVIESRIVLAMADGRVATTTFEKLGGISKVTTVFDAEKQNSEEMQKAGWQAILNNFKNYVENI